VKDRFTRSVFSCDKLFLRGLTTNLYNLKKASMLLAAVTLSCTDWTTELLALDRLIHLFYYVPRYSGYLSERNREQYRNGISLSRSMYRNAGYICEGEG